MQSAKRFTSKLMLITWDFLSVMISILVSFKINYPYSEVLVPKYYQDFFVQFVFVSAVSFMVLNLLFGNYSNTLKHFGMSDVLRSFFACALFTVGFFAVNTYFYDFLRFRSKFIILMVLFLTLLQLLGRSSVRLARDASARLTRRTRYKDGKVKRTLIFGAGEAGVYLSNKLLSHADSDLLPVVFIDDDAALKGRKINGVRVYGGSDKMDEAIKRFAVDEVIVAIPTASKQLLSFALDICRSNKCSIRRFGDFGDVELSTATVTDIDIEQLLRRDSVKLNMEVVRNFIEGKTVIVTGGAGSIGSEICRQVLSFGCKHLVIFDIHENGLYEIENELKVHYQGRFSVKLGSIRDNRRLDEVFTEFQPQLVFHAAAHKHVPMVEYSPKEAVKNNVKGTINVAMAAIMHHVEKFILISTDKAVNPTNVMGASKRIAEKAIQLLDEMSETEFSAVRFGNVLGSNGSVVPLFRRQIAEGGPVTVTHPDICRFFMTIPEAVQLVLEAGAMANGGEIFVLNMGEPVKIYDLACDLIRLSGFEPETDIKIEFTGLRPGEKLYEEISMQDEDMETTPNDKIFIMKPMDFDESVLSQQIKALEQSVCEEDINVMFNCIQELVPTFHHNPGGAQ